MKEEMTFVNAGKRIDRVILRTVETGIITKIHRLREEGYHLAWSGDGQLCYEKVVEGGDCA